MRIMWMVVAALIAGCAAERLAVSPPAGVDLSGKWHLNVADSDDPMRLSQALASGASVGAEGNGGQRGGRRGRGGGQGGGQGGGSGARGQGGGAGADPSSLGAAAALPVSAVSEVLHWPGQDLEVKQVGGVAAFASDGDQRVYQPNDTGKNAKRKHHARQICGWSGTSLIIQVDPDDDRPKFEEHYQLSDDSQRLVQRIVIDSGRMNGFTMSRVWDRVP
jgi:hypothetical protein